MTFEVVLGGKHDRQSCVSGGIGIIINSLMAFVEEVVLERM